MGGVSGGRSSLGVAALSQSPEERLRQVQDSMGAVERFFFNRPLKALNREHFQKIAKALLDAQFEATFQKITLAVDIEKKHAFVAYMRATDAVRRDLLALDAAARGEVAQMLQSIDAEIFKIRAQGERQIQAMLSKGLVTPKEADHERQKNEALCRDQLEASLKTLHDLWQNQRELLEHTLRTHLTIAQKVAALE